MHRATPRAATARAGRAGADRLDGAAREGRRRRVAAHRLPLPRLRRPARSTRINETQPGELRPRLNDGKVDRQGRFVAGSMDFAGDATGRQALPARSRSLGAHARHRHHLSPTARAGARTARPSTSPTAIRASSRPMTTTSRPATSARAASSPASRTLRGYPDGATVDAEGYVWSVEVYSGRLIRFDPNGVVDRIVGLPVQSTTSVIFGGADLDIAYVTSMARPYQRRVSQGARGRLPLRGPRPRRARHPGTALQRLERETGPCGSKLWSM